MTIELSIHRRTDVRLYSTRVLQRLAQQAHRFALSRRNNQGLFNRQRRAPQNGFYVVERVEKVDGLTDGGGRAEENVTDVFFGMGADWGELREAGLARSLPNP